MTNDIEYKNIANCNPRVCISAKVMKIQRITNGIFRKHLKSFDLSIPQLSILFLLGKKGAVSQKELSDFLYLEKSSVNRNIKKLSEIEYIDKQRLPEVSISKTGLDLLEQVVPYWEQAMAESNLLLQDDGIAAIDVVLDRLTTK